MKRAPVFILALLGCVCLTGCANSNQSVSSKTRFYYEPVDVSSSEDVRLSIEEDTSSSSEPAIKYYTVTWKNWNGTILEIDTNVQYGTYPTYNGGTPTKNEDQDYKYTFAGWDKELSAVVDDVTYTAVFDRSEKRIALNLSNYSQYIRYSTGIPMNHYPHTYINSRVYGGFRVGVATRPKVDALFDAARITLKFTFSYYAVGDILDNREQEGVFEIGEDGMCDTEIILNTASYYSSSANVTLNTSVVAIEGSVEPK